MRLCGCISLYLHTGICTLCEVMYDINECVYVCGDRLGARTH